MIVIHNFKQAVSLYQIGQIPFRLVQEQALVLSGISPQPSNGLQPGRYINDALEITASDIEWLLQQPDALDDYNGMLGGEVYICQCLSDLKQVVGMDMEFARNNGNRWPNVTDQVMSWDSCDYLDQPHGEPEWAVFLLCWNDAGGNVFYVPRHLWKAGRVAEHVAETNKFWG